MTHNKHSFLPDCPGSSLTSKAFRVVVTAMLGLMFAPTLARAACPNSWTQITTSTRPSPRADHTATFVPSPPGPGHMIVIGGETEVASEDVVLNDVWQFQLSSGQWTDITPANSPLLPREGHTAVLSPDGSNQLIVFGGFTTEATPPPGSLLQFLNDLWKLNLSPVEWYSISSLNCERSYLEYPECRWYHTATAVPAQSRMYMFGGDYSGQVYTRAYYYNVGNPNLPAWVLLPSSVNADAAVTRANHTTIYDAPRNRLVVFGGGPEVSASNDLWVYDLTTEQWTAPTVAGSLPPARQDHSAIFDATNNRMIIFGGLSATNAVLNDVWALSLAPSMTWKQLATDGTKPSAREEHTAVYDQASNRMVVFGGEDAAGNYLDDTWALSLDDVVGPQPVADLAPMVVQPTAIWPTWTAPADDGGIQGTCEYDLRYSLQTITESNFYAATRKIIAAPLDPGSEELHMVSGLAPCTFYYFAVKSRDEAHNWSAISNVVQRKTTCLGGGGAASREILATNLDSPYPEPASDRIVIPFGIPAMEEGRVLALEVYDARGRLVRTIRREPVSAGSQQATWDLRSSAGARVSPGAYFVRLRLGEMRLERRVTVLPQ